MRITSVFAVLAAAVSASPFPMMMTIEATDDYSWDIINWDSGCTGSGCFYSFNITGEASTVSRPPKPAFFANCAGEIEGAPYRLCTLYDDSTVARRVAAKLLPVNSTGTGAHIQVSYQYVDLATPTTFWNFTGKANTVYNQFTGPCLNFTITPDTIWGVA
ncbi:uncharacterized protein BCR38DRAFT_195487 [Pseudomassariella vexata]|uniref:AA1-like domain-containing protein n=1 Tax=Pseudomassariella vexata TaxID=1141098 RepID=A0A1Y2E1J9_9PEZI|nr:uncharacterized protein BCR38DRAFT_195487 [Pseudomassariella vexata]ORY65337.1 hypothetical protein BCR38DRAFT_195487 [Pseudomassariella vexata]